jgi:hypothetical protein
VILRVIADLSFSFLAIQLPLNGVGSSGFCTTLRGCKIALGTSSHTGE